MVGNAMIRNRNNKSGNPARPWKCLPNFSLPGTAVALCLCRILIGLAFHGCLVLDFGFVGILGGVGSVKEVRRISRAAEAGVSFLPVEIHITPDMVDEPPGW